MSISTAQQIIAIKSPSYGADPRLDDYVSLVKMSLAQKAFGIRYEYAVALLVLHQLTLESQSGGSSTVSGSGSVGGISSETEGQLSRTFGGISSNTPWRKQYLMSTSFGQEFQHLMNSCLFLPRNRFVNA